MRTGIAKKVRAGVRAGVIAAGCVILLASCTHLLQKGTSTPDGFKISPYFVYAPDHHVLMKFAVDDDQMVKPPLLTVNGKAKKYLQQKDKISGLLEADIGAPGCNQNVEVALARADNAGGKTPALKFRIKSFPCSGEEEISFLFIADTHGNASFYAREIPSILERHSDKNFVAIIHGGDWVNEGTNLVSWNQMAQAIGKARVALPIISAIGNHEYHGYRSWLMLPENRELQQKPGSLNNPVIFKKYLFSQENDRIPGYHPRGYYSIHYPQAVLIIINSNLNNPDKRDREKQWSFIKKEISIADLEKKPVIVVSHHSVMGSNIFRINKGEGRLLRERLIPILEKKKIDAEPQVNESGNQLPMRAVLSAHSHLYEMSVKKGIVYLNAGPFGGWPMFGLWGNPYQKESASFTSTYSIVTVSCRGISINTHKQRAGIWE